MKQDTPAKTSFHRGAGTLSILLALPLLASCGDGGGGTEPTPAPTPVATSVAVSPSSATLQAIGATVQLSASVRDQNGQTMTGASVSWSSSGNGVASVNSGGLSTAVSVGSATITASSGSASGAVSITVTQTISSVSVSPTSHTMVVGGGTVQFTATVNDGNGNTVQGAGVNWSSSDASRVSVDAATGLATPVQPGSATITATSGGVSGTANVTVLPPPVATVEVTPSSGSILVSGTLQLTATTRDGAGNLLTGREITWSSSDTTVAKVGSAGLVTGMKLGMATVTASSEGKNGAAQVTVAPPPVASVEVSPSSGSLLVGATVQLAAITRDGSGTVLTGRTVLWASSDTTVARVSSNGLVTGLAPGTVTIMASSEGKSGSAQINVVAPQAPVAKIEIELSGSGLMQVGQVLTMTAKLTDAQGNILTGRPVQWTQSRAGVVAGQVSGATAEILAIDLGEVYIYAHSEGKSALQLIWVTGPINCSTLAGGTMWGNDGQYLGRLTNQFDAQSILNPHGSYGSQFSPTSIYNPNSSYGATWSGLSAYATFTSTPPRVLKNDLSVVSVTKATFMYPRVDPDALRSCVFP